MRFSLWTAASGGTDVTVFITNAPIGVNNGVFTTSIDFGSGVFTGTAYWMQVGVRTNGFSGGYSSLSPRQQLTPTPYAIFAEGANGANLVGTIPAGDLTGVSGTGLTGVALLAGGNNFTGTKMLVVTSGLARVLVQDPTLT